jgi:protein-disulfide isomerase
MTRKIKKLTPIEKIKKTILTKVSALSLFVIIISAVTSASFLQLNSFGSVSEVSKSDIAIWIKNNPQAIIDSVQNMQKAEQKKEQENRDKVVKEKIPAKMNELINDKLDGSFTNGKPTINVIEFFDYNCGYCKRAENTVSKLKSEKNIKIIYKEYPILGKDSEELSKVGIAVNMISPEKYPLFHHKLMKSSVRDGDGAIKVAGEIGINVASLKSILKKNKKEIEDKIAKNRALARELSITGTPAFIIGNQLIPGAIGLEQIKSIIKEEREKK